MTIASRSWTTDESRHHGAGAARWPVLARLPDISGESSAARPTMQTAPGAVEYRFDPPQQSGSALNVSASGPSTLRNAGPTVSRPPHVFDRGRTMGTRGIPRRESPILPRSNPFSAQRTRLIDSVAPAIRFLTLVALFTAAGIWIQMMGRHASPSSHSMETPKTAAQPTVSPDSNLLDHRADPAPTAAGPLESSPNAGARVGRAGDGNLSSREQPAVAMPLAGRPTATPPHFLVLSGERLPRVQTTDPLPAEVEAGTRQPVLPGAGSPARDQVSEQNSESDESATVAQRQRTGFLIEIPTR